MTGGAGPVLLAASHGTASSSGQQAVDALVAEVATRMPGTEVASAYVDVQAPDVPSALARIAPERPVIIVPLLLSAGYHVHVDLAQAAARRAGSRVAAPLGPDPRLADLLAHRVRSAQAVLPQTVILAAAGSSDPRAIEDCRTMANALSERLRHPVAAAFLSSGTPSLEEARHSAGPGAMIGGS
jgi:sirohydrochlorin ferrochelatase